MLIAAGIGRFLAFAIDDESCIVPYAATESRGAAVTIGAGIHAAIGTGFDILHHRRVFRGTAAVRRASLSVAPIASPHVPAILLSSRF